MKYLRGFGQFINESSRLTRLGLIRLSEEQEEFLDNFTIEGEWEFDPKTGLVNVYGMFDCSWERLSDFKGIWFGTVSGDFDCSYNELTNLIGAPKKVDGHFDCAVNRLTSLKGAPKVVGKYFYCRENPDLQSLTGLPKLYDVEVPEHLEERLEQIRAEAKKLKSRK